MVVKLLVMTYNSSYMVIGLTKSTWNRTSSVEDDSLRAVANVMGLFDVGLPICKYSQSVDGGTFTLNKQITPTPMINRHTDQPTACFKQHSRLVCDSQSRGAHYVTWI